MNPADPPKPAAGSLGRIVLGILLTVALHCVAWMVMQAVSDWHFRESAFLILGVTQLIYMGPAIGLAFIREAPDIGKGLIIGAALTFLLNAACLGIFAVLWNGKGL